MVLETLREHGLTVFPETESEFCAAEGVVGRLANIHSRGPHENLAQREEIERSQGHVGCTIWQAAEWGRRLEGDRDAPPSSPIFSGEKAEFFIANVRCVIYPHGDRAKEQVDALERGMKDLEARLAADDQ